MLYFDHICQMFQIVSLSGTKIGLQSNLDISNSDISNSAKLEAYIWIENTFWLLSLTIIWRWRLFTSPNYPKCKLICTSGNLNLKKNLSHQLQNIDIRLYNIIVLVRLMLWWLLTYLFVAVQLSVWCKIDSGRNPFLQSRKVSNKSVNFFQNSFIFRKIRIFVLLFLAHTYCEGADSGVRRRVSCVVCR